MLGRPYGGERSSNSTQCSMVGSLLCWGEEKGGLPSGSRVSILSAVALTCTTSISAFYFRKGQARELPNSVSTAYSSEHTYVKRLLVCIAYSQPSAPLLPSRQWVVAYVLPVEAFETEIKMESSDQDEFMTTKEERINKFLCCLYTSLIPINGYL